MNSVYLLVVALCVLALAYRTYGAFIAAKVLIFDDSRKTPAFTCRDGREYVPTNKYVLFGHHFAAIAGAGPLIGPVLAAQYGWGPGFIWILIGSVFAGAVHDLVILFASVRHKGQSLASIARAEVGPITGLTTSIAILFIVVVALAGLGIVVVNALFDNPWGVYTILMTIPIAMGVGLYMFKLFPGAIKSGSIVGFLLVLGAVFTGHWVSGSSAAAFFTFTQKQLSIGLPVYGFIAAVLPVWLLLTPRDYLSSYMKIGTIAALALGIVIVQPTIQLDFTTKFVSGGGPIIPGPVWPYVFVTIACGAISGFHALISSGTTPKMIERESEELFIGYGAMLMEAFIGIIALIAATVLLPGDYFAINTPAAIYAQLGMQPVELDSLSQLVGQNVAHRPGGAVSLAVGMAHVFAKIPGMAHLMSYWYQFAIMFEALFILTTIDAGTRVARYILQDISGTYLWAPLKEPGWWPGIIFTSSIVTVAWGYLLYSGDVASIWPLFGVANQLLAVIALAIGTTIILKIGKKKSYALITAIPLALLSVTELAAGFMNVSMFFKRGDTLGNINGTLSAILIALVVITLLDCARLWLKLIKTAEPVGLAADDEVCQFTRTPPEIPS